MTLECPTCGSQDVRRASLAYEMGVQKTRNKTLGGGVALSMIGPIVGVGGAASRGRNTSLFAERFEPPKKVRSIMRTFLTFMIGIPLYCFAVLIGLSIGSNFSILLSGVVGLFCLFVLPVIVFWFPFRRTGTQKARYRTGAAFLCVSVAERFLNQNNFQKNETTVPNISKIHL